MQLYQKVDDNLNEAQIKAQAAATLEYYNRVLRSLKVSSLGAPGLHAGQMILVKVEGMGDTGVSQFVLLEKVTHRWENSVHTMELEAYEL